MAKQLFTFSLNPEMPTEDGSEDVDDFLTQSEGGIINKKPPALYPATSYPAKSRGGITGSGNNYTVYIKKSGQGVPVHFKMRSVAAALWLDEQFDNLTEHGWTSVTSGTGSVSIVSGKVQLSALNAASTAMIHRTDARPVPTSMEILIKSKAKSESYIWYCVIGNADQTITFVLYPQTVYAGIDGLSGMVFFEVGDMSDQDILWKLIITGNKIDIERDGVAKITDHALPAASKPDGYMYFLVDDPSESYTDYFTIEDKT